MTSPGHDHVGGLEAERADGVAGSRQSTTCASYPWARARVDARRVEVEPDELARVRGEVLVQPRAGLGVQRLATGVDEADVDDAPPGAELAEVLEAVDERRRREPVHHLELGEVVAHGVASSTVGSAPNVPRRSASGGPAPAAQQRVDLGERAAAVVPEEAAAELPGLGNHPERLVGVEVVRDGSRSRAAGCLRSRRRAAVDAAPGSARR